jgi:cytochrome c oxidase cbb3-type subunit 1/cytochrome c oxidase cbb3-type subunit I/II
MFMFLPVIIVIVNLWMTWRGKGGRIFGDPAGKWIALGLFWYLIVGAQGSLQSLPEMQVITHFNNWTVGHAHIAILGFSGFLAIGGLWHILPMITRRQLYSKKLVEVQFGLVMIGLTGFFIVLTIAGLIQGESWYNGEVIYRVLPELDAYMVLRAALGMFIIFGAFIGLYNVIMTIKKGKPIDSVEHN